MTKSFELVLFILLIQLGCSKADIRFVTPEASQDYMNSWDTPIEISWIDNGNAPRLSQLANHTLDLYSGNDSSTIPIMVYFFNRNTSAIIDYIENGTFVTFGGDFHGPNTTSYFFGIRSNLTSNPNITVTSYSDRFAIAGMNPDITDELAEANLGVWGNGKPQRKIACNSKPCVPSESVLDGSEALVSSPSSSSSVDLTTTSPTKPPDPSATSTSSSRSSSTSTTIAASSEDNGGSSASKKDYTIAGIVAGLIAFLAIIAGLVVAYRIKIKNKLIPRLGNDEKPTFLSIPSAFNRHSSRMELSSGSPSTMYSELSGSRELETVELPSSNSTDSTPDMSPVIRNV
ncbi:hypothetical protein IFR05_013666 [Cadophora sp. M221]|nr:hypothetical protein IFR05_013666 [Cadophora sp. M221]